MNYATNLRKLRESSCLSQEKVANDIGVSISSWKKYESGERTPRDEVKVKIADYFNSTVQEVFFS